MINKVKLGVEIKNIRLSLDMSLQKFADIVHLSKTHVFDLENGGSMPSVQTFDDICIHTPDNMQTILDRCKP